MGDFRGYLKGWSFIKEKNMIKHDNILYVRDIHAIGGVETYTYEMVKKYSNLDIAVVCKNVARSQEKRIKKYCKVYKHTDEEIECKVLITNWDTSIIKYVNEGAKVYTVLHTDYSNPTEILGIPKDDPRITYIGITEDSLKKFEKITKIKRTVLCRNPLELEKDDDLLILMSATRLTKIKDNGRILAIANELDKQGISYLWFIFTSDEYQDNPIWQNHNVVHLSNRIDVGKYFRKADWIIQPSICEGDSYTLKEALYRGKPIVVCELGYFKEIGINKENALFLKEDCSNVSEVVKKMKTPLKFEFKPVKDSYDKILAKGKSHYKQDKEIKVRLRCTFFMGVDLVEEGYHINEKDIIETDKERAEELLNTKCFELL